MESTLVENSSRKSEDCQFDHCIPGLGIVIIPALPGELSQKQIGILYPFMRLATKLEVKEDPIKHINVTIVWFSNSDDMKSAVSQKLVTHGSPAVLLPLYYTSDKLLANTIPSSDSLIMTGFPHSMDKEQLLHELPADYRTSITDLKLHADLGVALLIIEDSQILHKLINDPNITINSKHLTFRLANLVWDLTDYAPNEDISASRFEDNEELRFSLRSIEKFAPWLHHVYIVTNGQIPAWLNMDNPRLTIVTHKELFINESHLPTFSSPAIESHIHRIPGLSSKFIYMNDDVLFGKEVWPDDFYTAAGGQKVYLTWPVPNCQEGCPASWIKDGYCDKACNNTECEWDGGDCEGGRGAVQQAYQFGNQGVGGSHWASQNSDMYCSTGCANNWIADRYCDQSCNVQNCGFDAADCGTDNFNVLHGVMLLPEVDEYSARGWTVVYFNLSTIIGDLGNINEGMYDQDPIIRSVSVAQKFKVVTIVLHANHTAVVLNFTLIGRNNHLEALEFNFSVNVDTTFVTTTNAIKVTNLSINIESSGNLEGVRNQTQLSMDNPQSVFVPIFGKKSPQLKERTKVDSHLASLNLSHYELPNMLESRYSALKEQLAAGDITENGYRRQTVELWLNYLDWLHADNKTVESQMKRKTVGNEKTYQKVANVPGEERKELKRVEMSPDSHISNISHDRGLDTGLFYKSVLRRRARSAEQPGGVNKALNSGAKDEADQQYPSYSQAPVARAEKFPRRRLHFFSEDYLTEPKEEINKTQDDSTIHKNVGFLPWEKLGVFSKIQGQMEKFQTARDTYRSSSGSVRRHLLDTFANSLRHVSRTYNHHFGYMARKVPGHMAHMIDRHVVSRMQEIFPVEWDATSSHRVRSSTDMQFAFSYFYFLMSQPQNITIAETFSELDVDESGVLSDREIRTLATRIYDLPLDLDTLTGFELILINCSIADENHDDSVTGNGFAAEKVLSEGKINRRRVTVDEIYYDQRIPQITLELVERCSSLVQIFRKLGTAKTAYKFQVSNSVIFAAFLNIILQCYIINFIQIINCESRQFFSFKIFSFSLLLKC